MFMIVLLLLIIVAGSLCISSGKF